MVATLTQEFAQLDSRVQKRVVASMERLASTGAPVATDTESMDFIEQRALMGRGIGYIDVHLLASVALAGTARLWTRDGRLAAVAAELEMAFDEPG